MQSKTTVLIMVSSGECREKSEKQFTIFPTTDFTVFNKILKIKFYSIFFISIARIFVIKYLFKHFIIFIAECRENSQCRRVSLQQLQFLTSKNLF